MTTLFLGKPAILSAIGCGLQTHINSLLSDQPSNLALSSQIFDDHDIQGKSGVFGEIRLDLRPFPDDLPQSHRSRNNQLLWHALAQIEPQIEQAVKKFGKDRIAVIIGTSVTGVDENIPLLKEGATTGNWQTEAFNQQQYLFSAPADFVAEVYGLTGLCYGISTACTSGAKALISAARLLKANLCDAVICGGVDCLSLLTLSGFSSLSVLSPERTNPLSANRTGINIGEGAAVFVMTRELLQEESEQIALLGYGSSSDAYHMSSPHPEGEGAIAAFKTALNSTALLGESISAAEIDWINLHGTGTIHNDHMEALAVAEVFGEKTPVTTTKPYTGHTLGAAGAVEAAIVWGMISREFNPEGKLPAQLWDKVQDENLSQLAITDEQSTWKSERRIAASSSFAFGGNNAVLILGEQK